MTTPEVSQEDKDLAAAAKRKARGAAALGRLFGARKQSASAWGRTLPIPKHLRPRLEEYVFGPPKPRRLTPAQMRDLFDEWVREVGPDVVSYDLWAGMEAGFNNGIAREMARREPVAKSPEEPPALGEQRRA